MNDDELMDQVLRKSMAAPPPQLSPAFDAKVMAAVRPRRLTSSGRVVMGAYVVAALVLTVWTMREAGLVLIVASTLVTAAISLGLSSYARALAYRSDTVTRQLRL
jgi:hypothetical protein